MRKDRLFGMVEEQWRKEKVLQLKDFPRKLKCSETTVRRYLKKWNSVTSFSHKGRYYTLLELADFTDDGLWFYNGIGFSQYGNLIETIIYFVSSSESGLYASDLFELLRFKSYSVLARIMNRTNLFREKMNGKYIYFSADTAKRNIQIVLRTKINQLILTEQIPAIKGVHILVEFIKYPDISLMELSKKLAEQGIIISDITLYDFFEFHEILKKTQNFRQS
jgi:hypothetical protein